MHKQNDFSVVWLHIRVHIRYSINTKHIAIFRINCMLFSWIMFRMYHVHLFGRKEQKKNTHTYTMEIRLICTFIALFYRKMYYDARLLLTTLSIRQNGIVNISRIKMWHIFRNIFIFLFCFDFCFLFLIVVSNKHTINNKRCKFTRTNKLSFYVKDT